jgi:exosortase A-associated hydrolase 1
MARRGVVVVVGGPQYRVGSHRQFLHLARALAGAGIPVLRFDYRGMGDSDGEYRGFEEAENDIRSAIDFFFSELPDLQEVVLWGLCDAASACLFYASGDRRVTGLTLLNPWVRSDEGAAKALLTHYYWQRLIDPIFWRKVARGEFHFHESWNSLRGTLRSVFGMSGATTVVEPAVTNETVRVTEVTLRPVCKPESLQQRMLKGASQFRGRMLFVLSGDDLTAAEFKDVVSGSRDWRRVLGDSPRVVTQHLPEANHTFSQRDWRDRVAAWTMTWIRSW